MTEAWGGSLNEREPQLDDIAALGQLQSPGWLATHKQPMRPGREKGGAVTACLFVLNVVAKKLGKMAKSTGFKLSSARNAEGASWMFFLRKTI